MQIPHRAVTRAKVNLSLEITGKEGNLHTLQMIVMRSSKYFDEVVFTPTNSSLIEDIEFENCYDGFDELRFLKFFYPRVQIIARRLGVGGKLKISKRIPLGAGLGGSSACFVSAIKSMQSHAVMMGGYKALDKQFLLELGSDVPCMMEQNPCLVRGVGEDVSLVEIPFEFGDMVIEIAEGGSDTKACYALYDEMKSKGIDTSKIPELDDEESPFEMDGIRLFKNDLTLPAITLNPKIKDKIIELKKSYKHVAISGSGSAVIAAGKDLHLRD